MIQHQNGDIVWFQFPSLSAQPHITHGVFGRHGGVSEAPFGSLNAGPTTTDTPQARMENYRRIRATLPGSPLLVGTIPLQGVTVREITAEDIEASAGDEPALILPGGCDALITQVRGIGLFWAVADCTTILLVDPVHNAIGLTHAGWRGTAGAILRRTLDAMRDRYGTASSDLLAAIGPTIGPCCYEVDELVRRAFADDPLALRTAAFSTAIVKSEDGVERESLRLDLAASNHAQLIELGVPESRIEGSDTCPGSHTELFYSHRMEGGKTGRFAVVLGIL